MNNTKNFKNQKIVGLVLDIFISILIAIPFNFIDLRTAFSVGTIFFIILLLRRFI